uniref:Uncharacterized protein n=1 Tax=Leptospirillum ferriphilum TaxID=178606 RepID=A0A7C3QXH8_9BACT
MSSFSIAPAVALMLPAVWPFFLVLVALFLAGRVFSLRPDRRVFLADLSVLSGIMLVFGMFDNTALRHFFHPDRPMDGIPLLATLTFLARQIFHRFPPIYPEAATTLVGLLILLLPVLRQESLAGGIRDATLVYVIWMGVRLLYPAAPPKGIERPFLVPLFLASSALAALSPLSGSLLLGQIAGGMAAVTVAILLAALTGNVPCTAIEAGWVLGALILIGRQYVDISQVVIASLTGSLFLGAVSARFVRKIPGRFLWARHGLVIASTLAPLIIGVSETLTSLAHQGVVY